ncbi:MAG TPA: SsrA-binding protein SmpB [Candidatus Binatia bacterium]|nr:SsrA-binding protein SmpB [Candidatus Binatia bacterium]
MSDAAREHARRDITVNRRAFHDYDIAERYEAGLALTGSEVKSLRDGRANLKDAYARFFGDELYLVGVHISPYGPASQFGHEPERNRKLLLHRRELDRLQGKVKERGLTLVPLRLYWSKGRAKAEIGLAKGRKSHDKREAIRAREERREVDRALAAGRRRR